VQVSGREQPFEGEWREAGLLAEQSWLSKFGQADEWSFCLRAARMAREQERR
jgi:hypothetical protein